MKKYIFLLLSFLIIPSIYASDITRDEACQYQDGLFDANWPVNYPGYTTKIKNFYKKGNALYYSVNAYKDNTSSPVGEAYLWSFNCKTKKPTRLSNTALLIETYNPDYPTNVSWPYAEIDYADGNMLIMRVYNANRYCTDGTKWNISCQQYSETREFYEHFVYNFSARKVLRVNLSNSSEITSVQQHYDDQQRNIANNSNQNMCTNKTLCKPTNYVTPVFFGIYITDIKGNNSDTVLVNYVYGKSITDFQKSGSVIIKKSFFTNLFKNKLFQ